jgi:hypothetical protein
MAIGGFNPIFLRAGDDVDVCWRLQARGWKIGFAPSALIWHHHRASIRAYWRQQVGYGEGETWLMREHPRQFVRGRMAWRGHIYSPLPFIRSFSVERIHAGPSGSAAFPSIYRSYAHPLVYLPHSGRWQLAWIGLVALAILLWGVNPGSAGVIASIALLAAGVTASKCLRHGLHSSVEDLPSIGGRTRASSRALYHGTIATLHFVQPLARLYGRLKGIVTAPDFTSTAQAASGQRSAPSDLADAVRLSLHREVERTFWSERWIEARHVLSALADRVRCQGIVRNVETDSGWWEDRDMTIVDQAWFRLDVRALVEEHESGKCLCRLAMRPRITAAPLLALAAGVGLAAVLHRAGLIAWQPGVVLIALWAGALVCLRMTLASRLMSNAMNTLVAELGLAPLAGDRDNTSMLSTARPAAFRPRATSTPPAALPAPGHILNASPYEGGAPAALAGDQATTMRRIGVLHFDKTNP